MLIGLEVYSVHEFITFSDLHDPLDRVHSHHRYVAVDEGLRSSDGELENYSLRADEIYYLLTQELNLYLFKKTEKKVFESEKKLEKLFSSSCVEIFECSLDG